MCEKMGLANRNKGIPILYTRGTHYEVGFDVGRTFRGIIQEYMNSSELLNKIYLPLYKKSEGRKVYEDTLTSVTKSFPQYIREIQGVADGAQVDFHKLFLMQMDDITPNVVDRGNVVPDKVSCTTICVNQEDCQLIGHNEDTLAEVLNYFYFVSAHIIETCPQGKYGVKEERFTSLCYAGQLPGYTMSYNHHGFIFTINTLSAKRLNGGKTPRTFITRALLAAQNFVEAQQILRDTGVGAGDGCSLNMTFLKQEGNRMFHNAEMGPAEEGQNQSLLNILTASPGENLLHVNKYMRLPVEEVQGLIIESSNNRLAVLDKMKSPENREDLIDMLSDQSNKGSPVFHTSDTDPILTIATGVFDCIARTWTVYGDNPKTSEPLFVLPLVLKD